MRVCPICHTPPADYSGCNCGFTHHLEECVEDPPLGNGENGEAGSDSPKSLVVSTLLAVLSLTLLGVLVVIVCQSGLLK